MVAKTALINAIVVAMDPMRTVYANGYVSVRDGAISEIGPMEHYRDDPDARVLDLASRHLIMPGIVNTHCHVECGVVRGVMDDRSVSDRRGGAGALWETRRAMTPDAYHAGSALSLLDMVLRGITTTAQSTIANNDPECTDAVFAAVQDSGMRVVGSKCFMDDPSCDWAPRDFHSTPEEAIHEISRLRTNWQSERVTIVPDAIHDLYCSEALVRELHSCAIALDTSLFMHLSVSRSEAEYAQKRYGRRTVFELDRWGVLSEHTLLAHAVQIDGDEIRRLAERDCSIAVCPIPCTFSGGGIAPLGALIEAGVRAGFGLDGPETNNSLDPWVNAKMGIFLQRLLRGDPEWGSADLALDLLTCEAARVLGMEDTIGSLEPGKRADLICVDVDRVSLVPRRSILSNLIYSPDSGAVRHVFVDGEQIVSDGRAVRVDEESVVADAQKRSLTVAAAGGFGRTPRRVGQL